MLAVQGVLDQAEASMGAALLVFAQFIGTSVFMVAASAVFTQTLVNELAINAPGIDAEFIVAVGATGFRQLPGLSQQDMAGILLSYANATGRTFYVSTALAALAFFSSTFMGWVDGRGKKLQVGAVTEA